MMAALQSIMSTVTPCVFISNNNNLTSSHFNLLIPEGCRVVTAFIPLVQRVVRIQSQLSLWAKAGYTLDESPAHCRALTDGRGHHTSCQLHIRSNFGVQYLAQFKLLRYVAQFCPRGAGIQTSDLPITSQPALPTELQPLPYFFYSEV